LNFERQSFSITITQVDYTEKISSSRLLLAVIAKIKLFSRKSKFLGQNESAKENI